MNKILKGEDAKGLIEEKNYKELRLSLSQMNPADIAALFDELATYDLILIFRLLPKELASEVFVYLENDIQERMIKSFSDKEIKTIVDDIFIDDMVDLVEEMPANVVKRILKNTDRETREIINKILEYPDDSAGSIMTIEFVSLREEMTVKQAFAKIRDTGVDSETIYTCYVTDVNKKLIGTVSVRALLLADYNSLIKDIMEKNTIYVHTLDDREFVANQMKKYDFMSMPVLDKENRLVGIVTYDDAYDVIEEETEEDFALMAAMMPAEESYFRTSVFEHAKNRIVWLLFLMLSATATGIIITKYEAAFEALPILVAFIPMLMDTGGNCGSQSSTIVIRGMALDDIKPKDFLRVLFKELRIGLVVGIALALVNGIRIYIMYGNKNVPADMLSITVGLTIVCVVVLAKLLGCLLPMLAKKLKLDPAIMASPLITTMVDTCSVIIFFNVALYLLGQYM